MDFNKEIAEITKGQRGIARKDLPSTLRVAPSTSLHKAPCEDGF